jgi:hypothetical protein
MKHLRIVSLAAVLVTSLIAFAGSASATKLCQNKLNTATCGQPIKAQTLFEAKLIGEATITDTLATVKCKAAAIGGKTENEGSGTETVRLPDSASGEKLILTFGTCTPNCLTVVAAGKLEIHHIATTDNGTVTSSGLELTTNCNTMFGVLHCVYVTNNTDIGLLEGGSPAKLKISTKELKYKEGHEFCEETASWTAEYEVTTPKPLYVTAG